MSFVTTYSNNTKSFYMSIASWNSFYSIILIFFFLGNENILCVSSKKDDAIILNLVKKNRNKRNKYLKKVNISESTSPTLATVDISLNSDLHTLSERVEIRSKCYHKKGLKCTNFNCKRLATNRIDVEISDKNLDSSDKASFSTALQMCEGLLPVEIETKDRKVKSKVLRAVKEQNEGDEQSNPSQEQRTTNIPRPPPIPANFTITIFVVTYLLYAAVYYIISFTTQEQNFFNGQIDKIIWKLLELVKRYFRNFFPVYWLTKKDETREFALHKIRTYLLRYLSQERAEKIMYLVKNNNM